LTLRLSQQTIRKAKALAARRGRSLGSFVAEQIEILVGREEDYEDAERNALALLDQGFHLGGEIRARRDELHER
jgi:predicted DNA-binding protein